MQQRKGYWVVPIGRRGGAELGWGVRETPWEMGPGGSWCLAWEPSKKVLFKLESISVRFSF